MWNCQGLSTSEFAKWFIYLKMFIIFWGIFMYATGYLVMNATKLSVFLKHNIIFANFIVDTIGQH